MIQIFLHSIITFIDLTSLDALVGAALCSLLIVRKEGIGPSQVVLKRFKRLFLFCIAGLFISLFGGLIQRSAEMGGVSLISGLGLLPTVISKTHYGCIWIAKMTGFLAAVFALLFASRYIGSPFFSIFILGAGATIAFARSASGHLSDFGDLSIPQISDFLHILAVVCLVGPVLALPSIFEVSGATEDTGQQNLIAGIADRYYLLFGPALAVLVATGSYNANLEVGSLYALVITPYGIILCVKLAVLLVFAFRYIAPPQHGRDEQAFAVKVVRKMRVDAVLVLVILLCAAMLTHGIPAKHFMHQKQNGPGQNMQHDHNMEMTK